MRLKELQLLNFKNHLNSKWEFKDDAICFIGDNGSGKTNILEAISLFSPGRGLRGAANQDLINMSKHNMLLRKTMQIATLFTSNP